MLFGSQTMYAFLLVVSLIASTTAKSSLLHKTRGLALETTARDTAGVRGHHRRILQGDEGEGGPEEDLPTPDDEEPSETAEEKKQSEEKKKSDGGPKTRSGIAGPSKRKCTTKQDKGHVNWECKASTEDDVSEIKDEIKFKVGATKGDFLKIDIEYESEIEDNDTDVETETETKYKLVYDRIIEYRKVGSAADDHYEWDVDEIVNTWPLDTWGELTPVESDGDTLTFSASDGVASFKFTISQVDSFDLTANRMKIDVLVEDYPWDASGDTFLALISQVETKRKTKTDGGEPGTNMVEDVTINFADVVDTAGFIPFGEYNWAKSAEASSRMMDGGNATDGDSAIQVERSDQNITDGFSVSEAATTIDVIASTAPDTQANGETTLKEIAFSFVGEAAQGASRIYWDPEAGVGYNADDSSAGRAFGSFSLVLGVSSVGMLLLSAL